MANDPFAEMESELSRHQRAVAAKEKENKWLRPIGFVARLITYGLLFLVLWVFKPDDISSVPLARLTLADIMKTVAWIAVLLLLGKALFNPSDEDVARDGWGGLGILMIVAVVVAFVGFSLWGVPG
jgi:cation transport ATPase